ncbi:MAG: chaperonin GroES [Francisella sp.]|jgi:chaperonin GroES
MIMNIRPLQDRVLVRRAKEETKSAGGIILTGSAQEKPSEGEIVAVGNGKKLDNGSTQPMDVKAGDKVLFGKFAGSEVKVGDEDLLMMIENDIMGIIG